MTVLSVNLNKVALLRNQRDLTYPNVVGFARICLDAGAGGITVHPRPDERHIRKSDVHDLAAILKADYNDDTEFNVEGYPSDDFLELVETIQPHQITLVPDDPDQSTSDHGWDIPSHMETLKSIVARLKDSTGARIALFVDDDTAMAQPAAETGADRVELYTGPYNHAFMEGHAAQRVESFARAADAMHRAGLGINAGHDLNLDNLPRFLSTIPYVEEVSIGHALTADALTMGMSNAIRAYLDIIAEARAVSKSLKASA